MLDNMPTGISFRTASKKQKSEMHKHEIGALSAVLAALCMTLLLGTTIAAPPAEARSTTYNLDIPSQSLKDALQALALASQHKLLYSAEGRSEAVRQEFASCGDASRATAASSPPRTSPPGLRSASRRSRSARV